jgi:hypothetical protein
MMRIIQSFTEQNVITTLGTIFCVMEGEVTDEAMTSDEEQICIVVRQMRKGIESETIHCHEDRSRKVGSFIELYPMGIVVIRHNALNYVSSFLSTLLYDQLSHRHVTMKASGQ